MKREGIIGLALAGVAGLWLALKAKAEPPPEGYSASIGIQILDSQGNPVPHNSPFTLEEGGSYILRATVTNQSTKGGQPWEAQLRVCGFARNDSDVTYFDICYVSAFAAGITRNVDFPFTVPIGDGGQTGLVGATVTNPEGTQILDDVYDTFSVTTLDIVYGATVDINIP